MFRCSHTIFRELNYPCMLKLHFVKIFSYGSSVYDRTETCRSYFNVNFNIVFKKIICAFVDE